MAVLAFLALGQTLPEEIIQEQIAIGCACHWVLVSVGHPGQHRCWSSELQRWVDRCTSEPGGLVHDSDPHETAKQLLCSGIIPSK